MNRATQCRPSYLAMGLTSSHLRVAHGCMGLSAHLQPYWWLERKLLAAMRGTHMVQPPAVSPPHISVFSRFCAEVLISKHA